MLFIWVILAGLLQATVLRDFNLMLVLTIFAGLRKGPFTGLFIGGAIGIFVEILSGFSFGFSLMLYSLIGFISGMARAHIYYRGNVFMDFVFSFCGVFLFYFVYFIFTNRVGISILYTALLTSFLSPLLFRVFRQL